MELVTETVTLVSGVFTALYIYTTETLVRLRQILRSATTYTRNNTLLLIVGALVAISGVYMNYNQTEIMVTADKIYECGPLAFGVDVDAPLSIWNIIQGVYNILEVMRANFLGNVMRVNSALVWSRQAILSTFNFIRDIKDKTKPAGILDTLQALYELFFMIGNLVLEIPVFQIPVFDTIVNIIYLLFQCLALLGELIAGAVLKGTVYSENCNVCEYKLQYLNPLTTTCYTTNYSALIFTTEVSQVNCSSETCINIGCTLIECLAFSVEATFSWTKPCFGYDVGPLVEELSAAGCCLVSTIDRGLFIGVSVLEQVLFTILYGSSNCMPLDELANQVVLLTVQFLGCVDDIICVLTGGDVCNFVQMIIDWINNNILFFINGVAALGQCAEQSAQVGCPAWPDPGCNSATNGFADCVKNYTDCLQKTPFWQQTGFVDVFDFIYEGLSILNGALCGPVCITDPAVTSCLSTFPFFSDCPTTGPFVTCWTPFQTCVEAYQFWNLIIPLLDFVEQILAFVDWITCGLLGVGPCLDTAFGTGGPCNFLSFDVNACVEALFDCLTLPPPPTLMLTTATKSVSTYLLWATMVSPDTTVQGKVEACIVNGMFHDMNACMNGCRFDHNSCLNSTYFDRWNDHSYAQHKIQEYQSSNRDLLKGKCGPAKFFGASGNVDFLLPKQLSELRAYHGCIIKDSHEWFASKLFNYTILFERKRDEARKAFDRKRTLFGPGQCMISLNRFDDDEYMEQTAHSLQLFGVTKAELNQVTKNLFQMFLRSAPMRYISNLAATAKYNVSNDVGLHQEVCQGAHQDKVVNLFHTSRERYVAINSMLLCNCLNSTGKTQQYNALDRPHRVTGNAEMTCEDMKDSVQRMIVAVRMEHHKSVFEEDYEHMMRPLNRDGQAPFLLRLYQNRFENRLNGLATSSQRYRLMYKGRPSFIKSIMEPTWKRSPERKKLLHKMTGLYGPKAQLGADGSLDLFGTVLNNTFCFINGFSVIPSGPMPAYPEPTEDFHAYQNGKPVNTTFYEVTHEKMKKAGYYEWLPFAERVATSAVNNFGVDQYGFYKPMHMFFSAISTRQTHKIIHYLTGTYDWDMQRGVFINLENSSYPFPILKPPGLPIWDASNGLSTNLGIFVFFNVTLSTFFSWAGYDLNLQAVNVFNSGYQPAHERLYDVWNADDEVNCYQRGSYYPCIRLQKRAVLTLDGNQKVYNEPRQLFRISKEQFKSEKAYQRYLLGSNDPADFNANQWFEDILNYLGTLLFGTAEDAFSEVVDEVTDIVESVNVTKELIILLYKLNEATACTWPDQVNGSTVYNPFCFPLLPATLGSWITPLPTAVLRPQIPWPQELIQDDCVNVYNGKSFSPSLSPNYLTQSAILEFVNTGFAFSNNCRVNLNFGSSVATSPLTGQMIVGSIGTGQSAGRSGEVFVYPQGVSSEVQRLYALDPTQGERFGYSLEVWGNQLAVGAPSGQRNNGYVALYEFVGGQWVIQTNLSYLDISNPLTIANNEGDAGWPFFGSAVVMTDDVIAVSAITRNASKGAVYLYRPGEHTPYQRLQDEPALPSLSFFGFSLASPRDTSEWLFVGQSLWNSSIGQEQVFRRNTTDGTYYFFQTLSFPDLALAILTTDPSDRPQFGIATAMADDVPTVACIGAPFGFYSGSAGHVYCYKFDGSTWALSISIADPGINAGGFGIGVWMNSTHLYVTTKDYEFLQVYEFTGAYTGVTLVDTIPITGASSLAGAISSALDVTDSGFWITGQPQANSVVYDSTQIIQSQNETEFRPFCPDGCDYCPRTYIEGGCRALKFKDFLDSVFFLLAMVPVVLNVLFVFGLSLRYLEQVYTPVLFVLDLSRFQLLLPNTRAMYLFLWFLQLVFQRDNVPLAPLLVITIIAFYVGINYILPFFIPALADILSKIQSSSFGFLFVLVAFLIIGQVVSLFIAFNGFSFSINKVIVDVITSIQETGYIFSILPGLDIIKFKAGQFVYENPSDIPYVDFFCFFWTYYNLGLMIIAVPVAYFLLLTGIALLSNLRTFLSALIARITNWMAIVYTSFRTNKA